MDRPEQSGDVLVPALRDDHQIERVRYVREDQINGSQDHGVRPDLAKNVIPSSTQRPVELQPRSDVLAGLQRRGEPLLVVKLAEQVAAQALFSAAAKHALESLRLVG